MLFEEEVLKLVMDHAPKKGRILEVECKSGNVAMAIARGTGNAGYGIDHSGSAISEAKRRARHLRDVFLGVQEDEELGLSNSFFHLAYSIRTLHETRAKKALEEMYCVLYREALSSS